MELNYRAKVLLINPFSLFHDYISVLQYIDDAGTFNADFMRTLCNGCLYIDFFYDSTCHIYIIQNL